jgi:hypothetical protein
MKKLYLSILLSTVFLLVMHNGYCQVGSQNIKICVISDLHYFDSTLLINDGPAFQNCLINDPKMLKESHAIMVSLFDSLVAEHPDIVIIPGDMTNNGELICHQGMLNFIQQLQNINVKVFVTPGNHDINNTYAVSFDNDTTYHVASITPAQFKTMYNNCGYSGALKTDTASLSYVAEPIAGLQILSMDVCRYDPIEVSGGFKPQVLQWCKDRLTEAKQSGKVVLGMEHHNFMEHYKGQATLFPAFVISDYDTISTQFADLGLKIIFTGHFHAQDIVEKTTAIGNTLFDVETGSPSSYPCPYRIMTLTTDTMLHITGKNIENINYNTDTMTFQQYALNVLQRPTGLPTGIMHMLTSPPFNLDSVTAHQIEPAVTETFIAHCGGNESNPSPQTVATIAMLEQSPMANFGYILDGIWTDLPPDDWTVNINLNSPTYSVGVAESFNINKILLSPNPSNGVFNLLLPDIKSTVNIKIFNINGKLVYQKDSKNNTNVVVDVSDKAAGEYIIQLKINNTIISKKFIKN